MLQFDCLLINTSLRSFLSTSFSQFGFIAYENEEGKNLFFHMSEVEGEGEIQASV